jgi:mannosyltransferase
VRVLALVVAAAAGLAWLCAQIAPAWSPRYLAVLLGPLLFALAAVLARGPRWTTAALAAVAAVWLMSAPPAAKSNARSVAAKVAPSLRPGDLVVSTQPEQVPVLHRYLPAGLVYVTPLGSVRDPRLTDWRDGVARLRAGRAERVLAPSVDRLGSGRRILLVTPVTFRRRPHVPWTRPSQAPWSRTVRARTREWRAALRADPRLRSIGRVPRSAFPRRRSTVRAEIFEVRGSGPARRRQR